MEVTHWNSEQRGRFQSLSSVISLPGIAFSGRMISSLGNLRTLQLGLLSQLTYALVLSQATKGAHWYWAQPLFTFAMGSWTSLSAMSMVAGSDAGLARGELQGSLSTMQSTVRVVAPILWSQLYELGVRRGSPGSFYFAIAAVHAARLALSAVPALREVPKTKHA